MKTILLFGAGKSATVLISYLLENAVSQDWSIIVADADKTLIEEKTGHHERATTAVIDITDEPARRALLQSADLVISMMPAFLHILIARDCIHYGKHLLTASYADEEMKALQQEVLDKDILFLCEMGLDPGIDHMSALQLLNRIKAAGGEVTSFKSHCGGLVAPESDDNPWKYKISWNPRNVVLAGKAGAVYKMDGKIITEKYEDLFDGRRLVDTGSEEIGILSYYPNRNSLPYIDLYKLTGATSFVRTTLRYPDFMYGWKNVVDLKLTDETPAYETDGKTLQAFFKEHMARNGFGEWINQKLSESFNQTRSLLDNLMKLMEAEEEAQAGGEEVPENFMLVDEKGDLKKIELDDIKNNAAATMAIQVHEANLTLKQLMFLGMDDDETLINKGFCSAADVLQLALEKKLALQPHDKDMVVMLHEIEYMQDNIQRSASSLLVVKGTDNLHTAMAKTVGLPLGIAAKLILDGSIKLRGLHIPTVEAIYDPVLKELRNAGIEFEEKMQ